MTKKPEIENRDYSKYRVMIALASAETLYTDTAMAITAMVNHNTSVRLRTAMNSYKGLELAHIRNMQVKEAERLKATHILFVGPDIATMPFACQRLIDVMLDHELDAVGVTLPNKTAPYSHKALDDGQQPVKIALDDDRVLIPASSMKADLLLVSMNAIEDLEFPYFMPSYGFNGEEFDANDFTSCEECFVRNLHTEGKNIAIDVQLSQESARIGTMKFDFTSEDFFADAVELRRQKAEELVNKQIEEAVA